MEEPTTIVTRFAPSPTGFMHIGGVRTALFAYLWAKKNDGTFILRIEDTDKEREVAGSIEHIQKSLKWLGIQWDIGPDTASPFGSLIQSERLDTYQTWAHKLVDAGHAYPDPYTQEQVEVFRQQAQAEKRPFLFRNHRPETFDIWDGTTPLRFKVPTIKRYEWIDEVRGPLSAGEEALDDFIIMKADGYPTYNFAHIIDDYYMKVTHIMRADEFLSSTPKFLSLYDALEIDRPQFVTLPPILRDDRTKKLGKRDGAKDILDYRDEGYLPEALVNYLAFIGWNPGTEQEIFSMQELIENFSIEHIQKGGGAFSDEKLNWFNREYIKKLSPQEFWDYAHPWIPTTLQDSEILHKIEYLIRDRIEKFSDVKTLFGQSAEPEHSEGEFDYFFHEPKIDHHMLIWKTLKEDPEGLSKTKEYLKQVHSFLEALPQDRWNYDGIKAALMEYADQQGKGNVLWPLRVALTGREKSPDPFEVASIIGKDQTLSRILAVQQK
jgi:glutamyl-tRNA synthetase